MENTGRKNGREDRNQPGPGSFHVVDLDDKEDPPVLEEAGTPAAPVMRHPGPAAGNRDRIYTGRQENRAGGREMPQEGGRAAGAAPLPRMPGTRPAAPSAATPAAPSGRAGDTSGDSIRHAMPGGVTPPSGREGDMPAGRAGAAYDAGSDAYVRFMDDVQWEIIRAIGEEGISVYRDIEGRIRQGHREFTNSRIRTSLKLLEGHGFIATGKSVGPSGRNCTICMLTDAGMKIFRWKYGKAPAIPEAGRKAGDGAPRPADPLEGPAAQEGLPAVKRSYGSVHAQEETPPDGLGAEKISVTIRDRSAAKDIIGRKGRFSPWDFVAFRTGDDSEPVCGYLISTKRGEIEVGTLDSGVRKYSTKYVHGMHHIVVVAEYPAGDQILRVTAHNKAGLYGFIGELILADADKGAVKDFVERFGIAEDLAEFL